MLSAATAILCGESTDSRLDQLLPLVVTAAGALAFLMVDRGGRWGLPRDLADILSLGTLGILFLEYRSDETQVIQALGHWLVYLQLIWYFLPKSTRDDWILFLLGLTQVLIGSVINQGDLVGLWLFLWSMLAVWVLGLFFLQREASRFKPQVHRTAVAAWKGKDDPYHGLFDFPFLGASLRVLALTLLLGGFFFLLLPRQAGATRARTSSPASKHLTGFDEEVRLGQLGEILENDTVVMSVEFSDGQGASVRPNGEPLWRGVTLAAYEDGRWQRRFQRSRQTIVAMGSVRNDTGKPRTLIRQNIKLEANDSRTLFAIRPILGLAATGSSHVSPSMNPTDGTIARSSSRGPYDYEVLSDADPTAPQDGELPPSPGEGVRILTSMDPELKAQLRAITEPLVARLPRDELDSVAARARAIEIYLRDSGKFSYTLVMKTIDPTIDPVLDFLVNRKEGHCEYFASALCLMLRSIDIPARMVNGFKGGDWNELTRSMNVRQKHAHSWVEAYAGMGDHGTPIWVVLDPTPGNSRDQSVAQVGGITGRVRPFTDILRYVWVFYILGYDSSRQNKLLYNPIKYTVQKVHEGYVMLWRWARDAVAHLFRFHSISSFISFRGFLVSFIVLAAAALLFRMVSWLVRRLIRFLRGAPDDDGALTPGILFYRRLVQLLSGFELQRGPAETQNEFAVRAARFLAGKGARTEAVAAVPSRIVDAFYRVRFGRQDLDPETLSSLEHDLDALENRLGATDHGAA